MTQFLQIGNKGFNIDRIQTVNLDYDGDVWVYFDADAEDRWGAHLTGPEADAFRHWWENKATVYVAPVSEALALDTPETTSTAGPDWNDPKYSRPGRNRLFKTVDDWGQA